MLKSCDAEKLMNYRLLMWDLELGGDNAGIVDVVCCYYYMLLLMAGDEESFLDQL